jgi:hypothetical protein
MESKRKTSINATGKPSNMWQEILREAMPKTEIENTNVFVFGDKMSGKRSLFKVMNRNIFSENDDSYRRILQIDEDSSRFGLLDYTYLNIKNSIEEKSEVIGKLSVWIMNDFMDKEKLLKLINPGNIVNSICIIIADLSRPWLIKQTLLKWTKFIQEIFNEIISKFPEDKQNEIKENGKKKKCIIIILYYFSC